MSSHGCSVNLDTTPPPVFTQLSHASPTPAPPYRNTRNTQGTHKAHMTSRVEAAWVRQDCAGAVAAPTSCDHMLTVIIHVGLVRVERCRKQATHTNSEYSLPDTHPCSNLTAMAWSSGESPVDSGSAETTPIIFPMVRNNAHVPYSSCSCHTSPTRRPCPCPAKNPQTKPLNRTTRIAIHDEATPTPHHGPPWY